MEPTSNYMNQEQFTQVLEAIPTLKIRKWDDYDIEFLFKNMYEMALRPMEGIMLKREDFNLIDRQVYLGKTKTRKEDYAVIPRGYVGTLSAYLDTKDQGRLTPELTYHTFWQWLVRLGKMLEIQAWTTPQAITGEKTKGHIFRKSKGKDLIQELGANAIPVISQHLRHTKPSITMNYYLKSTKEAVKEVI